MVTTLDKFGRIIIPKRLREHLGITPHTTLNIREEGNKLVIEPVPGENSIIEKEGILVFTGNVGKDIDDLIQKARKSRSSMVSGE